MHVTVIGATGMIGSRVTREALGRGHAVRGVTRRKPGPDFPVAADAVQADATDTAHLATLFGDSDAVVSAVRPRVGAESSVAATTTALLDAAAAAETRILIVGGAGPLWLPDEPGRPAIDNPNYVPAQYQVIAGASVAQLRACEPHPADWVYAAPPAIVEPGVRTGVFRLGTDTLVVDADGRSSISAEDFAIAIVDELERPGGGRRLTAGY